MGALRRSVVAETLERVRIVYLDRDTARWWNARKGEDDTPVFCGWFWVLSREEAGPFRTRSACMRDAYYRFVLRRQLPTVGHKVLNRQRAQTRKQALLEQARAS